MPQSDHLSTSSYRLEDVFNEASFPEITFVDPDIYPFIRSALRAQGKHVTLTGPSGSRKTSLIRKLLKSEEITESDILAINGRQYIDTASHEELFGRELRTSGDFKEITSYLQMMRFVIIDDFHHLSFVCRQAIAQNLKLWHEHEVRFIIIGIASSANEILGVDAELGIRNDSFALKEQSDEFIGQLISKGENALNIAFSADLKTEIVKASSGIPSVAQVISRTACITQSIERTQTNTASIDFKLRDIHDHVLRIFHNKYFEKVLGLAKGKQQARSVHNTYFDIVREIAAFEGSEIPVEHLRGRIVSPIADPKEKSRKSTSFYNCLNNLKDVIEGKGLTDMLIYKKDGNYISIEDPSFRFYLNLIDIEHLRKQIPTRADFYSYDVAISFAGEDRQQAEELVKEMKERGLVVFYDFDKTAELWGKDLAVKLAEVYQSDALFMVILISSSYPFKDWTSFELSIGQTAASKRPDEYLLPVRLDDTTIVGLRNTVAYVSFSKLGPSGIADLLAEKLQVYCAVSQ